MAGPQQGNDLFGVDNPDEAPVMIDDGQRAEVVFVEELGHFATVGVDITAYDVALR